MKCCIYTLLISLVFLNFASRAQTPGIIVRPAGTAGPSKLDPNLNGYTSISTSGFANDDIGNSEIPYKVVAPVIPEPTGDLLRGPNGSFSDIVKTFDGSGFYMFSDGTNLLCRLRIGGIVSGSKGYSVLLDTDQRFGPTGPYADPDFQPATNGNNGNPGFEFEIVLETNFRVAIYNVNGTSSPVFVTSYTIGSNSQISVAATRDGGDPDYFYDFYVPYAAMGLSASSFIRATATTVMSPGPAIGGPKSDIYGLGGNNYMDDWMSFIQNQPAFQISSLTSAGAGIGASCTNPPIVNGGISPASSAISGSWTKSSYSAFTSATITVYKGAAVLGTTSVTSGGVWSIPVSGLLNTDVITAKAQAVGESNCLSSNAVIVNSCNNGTHTTAPAITCSSIRGFEGTMVSGASVKLYKYTSTGYVLYADDATTTYKITYPSSTTWRYDDANTQSGSACTGGPSDVPAGSYAAVAQTTGGCASLPTTVCISGTTAPAAPVITSQLLDGSTTIKGTGVSGTAVNLWINGYFAQSQVVSGGGTFSFTLVMPLVLNDQVEINAASTGSCVSTSANGVVSCYLAAPVINSNGSGNVGEASKLSGTSSAGTGSTITVYNSTTSAVLGTTTVAADGTWILNSPTVVVGTTYIAAVTGHTCGTSAGSNKVTGVKQTAASRCGTINGPVSETATSISGTVTTAVAGTVVALFVDGVSVGSTTISGTAWSIPVNTTSSNGIYPGAVITISIAEASSVEIMCAASQTVTCNPPASPVVTPLTSNIVAGQTVNFTINPTQSGILYSLRDNPDTSNVGGSKFGNSTSLDIVSYPFNTPGTYTVKVKASSFSGSNCTSFSTATVTVTGTLPVTLTNFSGKLENGVGRLHWETAFEQDIKAYELERSTTTGNFKTIATVYATGGSQLQQSYSYTDQEVKTGVYYYRLKIIDKNNALFQYSKVIVLKQGNALAVEKISPNPFGSSLKLNLTSSVSALINIKIADLAGRPVKTENLQIKTGSNEYLIEGLAHIPTGIYVIQIMIDGEKIHQELIMKK